MYRAALIGCGKIGCQFSDDAGSLHAGICTHAAAYAANSHVEFVAVCDADKERAKHCATRWNVPSLYCEPVELLRIERPDIVSIATPDETHFELIRHVIVTKSAKAVLAEKPLAMQLRDAKELVRLAKEHEVLLSVNYIRRFSTAHVELANSLKSGRIGDLKLLVGIYTKGTLHNGTHLLDLVRWLAGDVEEVTANDRLRESTPDPTLDIDLKLACGAKGTLSAFSSSDYTVFELDLIGTRGRARIVDSGNTIEYYRLVHDRPFAGYRQLEFEERMNYGLRDTVGNAVNDLVNCLRFGTTPRCTGTDGVEAIRLALDARLAAGIIH